MTTFKYKARTSDGTLVDGVVEAYDQYEAIDMVRQTCPIVESLTPIKEKRRVNIDINEPLWVEDKTLALTASQFSIMLKAGLPMTRVVELIADQTTDKLMRRILTACAKDVAAGNSLARSLEKNGKKIPAVFIETVRAGEESGTLEDSFDSLKTYYDRTYRTKKKVRSALTYPIILIILAVVVVGIVMVVLVPTMTQIFENMNTELPFATRLLMGISHFFQNYWPIMLMVIGVLGIAFFAYGRTNDGRLNLSRLRLKLPVLGRIAQYSTAAQVANTLATMIAAGLPITRCVDVVSRILDLKCVGAKMEKSVAKLETGCSLGETLAENEYLPDMLIEMATVGEQSGSLEHTLRTVGEYYNNEAVTKSDDALAMLEPMITIFMGILVGFIVIAIYIPMFSMYSGAATLGT